MWTTLWDHSWMPLQWGAVIGASLVAAATDIRSRRIPNKLTLPFFLAGLVWATCIGGWSGLQDAFAGSVLAAFPFILLFIFAGGGAGDAKIMGAIGAWLGVIGGLVTMLAVAIAGGVLAIIFALMQKQMRAVLLTLWVMVSSVLVRVKTMGRWDGAIKDMNLPTVERMPYGVAILTGTCLAAGVTFLWHATQT